MDDIKRAEKILKNYQNFIKLSKISDKPFSIHGGKLVREIDKSIEQLDDTQKGILTNLYINAKRNRKSRQRYCIDHGITVKEYAIIREQALLEFLRCYLDNINR